MTSNEAALRMRTRVVVENARCLLSGDSSRFDGTAESVDSSVYFTRLRTLPVVNEYAVTRRVRASRVMMDASCSLESYGEG